MQLKNMLSLTSNEAVALADLAAHRRKDHSDRTYVMRCLRSKDMREVQWARKQLGLDKPILTAKPRLVKINKATNQPYTTLKVEP